MPRLLTPQVRALFSAVTGLFGLVVLADLYYLDAHQTVLRASLWIVSILSALAWMLSAVLAIQTTGSDANYSRESNWANFGAALFTGICASMQVHSLLHP
jgi:hypothetical protein